MAGLYVRKRETGRYKIRGKIYLFIQNNIARLWYFSAFWNRHSPALCFASKLFRERQFHRLLWFQHSSVPSRECSIAGWCIIPGPCISVVSECPCELENWLQIESSSQSKKFLSFPSILSSLKTLHQPNYFSECPRGVCLMGSLAGTLSPLQWLLPTTNSLGRIICCQSFLCHNKGIDALRWLLLLLLLLSQSRLPPNRNY